MTEIKRTWSMPTSPRNPYKLPDELALLKEFEGQIWNKDTQISFAERLSESVFFEGSVSAKEPDFSARDRVNRAPKTFGFVRFDQENRIKITDAGNLLIEQKRLDELFFRQLLKWQYPSPKHCGPQYINFNIKPFVELLRLMYELDGLSKREIAMFCVSFINWENYSLVKNEILEFRHSMQDLSKAEEHQHILETHKNRIRQTYVEELAIGNIRLRQQGTSTNNEDQFIETKLRNSIDYADATIRYFRATGLFTLSSHHFRLSILDIYGITVEDILTNTVRSVEDFSEEREFLDYLGNPYLPALPTDNKEKIIEQILSVKDKLPQQIEEIELSAITDAYLNSIGIGELKDKKEELEAAYQNSKISSEIENIKSYNLYQDIVEIFEKILDRKDIEIPDKPLFLEWNTWRALNMLDDGNIIGHCKFDIEGKPLSTAPGKTADIVCEYKDFVLVVEVTLTSGARQYETEHEPVARHLADVKKNLRAIGDNRPVYGLFIAPSISEATVADFYIIRKTEVNFYGGKTNFIPMNIITFINVLQAAKNRGGILSRQILKFIKWADSQADSNNEAEWFDAIESASNNWVEI
jgi:hypothetical protein